MTGDEHLGAPAAERRLHPLTLGLTFARSLREFIVPSVIALFGIGQQDLGWVGIGGAVLLGVLAISAVARYLRYTYRYDADQLVVRSGVFFRNERHIPYARIQNIDAVQNPLHRVFGVVVVHVQTGAGAAPEASLSVLPVAALDEMRLRVGTASGRPALPLQRPDRTAVEHAGAVDPRTTGTVEPVARGPGAARHGPPGNAVPAHGADAGAATGGVETLLHLETRELLVGGFVDNRAMVVILAALALLERANVLDRIASRWPLPDEAGLRAMAAGWFSAGVRTAVLASVVILVLLLVVRLFATAWTAVRLYDFRLVRTGQNLRSEYGLFTRVTATVPLRRIQVIVVTEGLLHRLLGRVEVSVVTAGGVSGRGTPKRERVAPILRRDRLPELLRSLQPGLDLAAVEWRPVHPRAFGRMVRGSLVGPIVITALAGTVIGWWSLVVLTVLLVRLVVDRAMRARYIGWALSSDGIVMRGGGLRRSTRVARFNRIQVVALDQNPFDRRAGMADLTAVTAGTGGTVAVTYLPRDVAEELHSELSARVAASEFTW